MTNQPLTTYLKVTLLCLDHSYPCWTHVDSWVSKHVTRNETLVNNLQKNPNLFIVCTISNQTHPLALAQYLGEKNLLVKQKTFKIYYMFKSQENDYVS